MTNRAKRSRSTELTGGEGFTYEDTIVAYYLTALLHEDAAAGLTGHVVRVAVQQAAAGDPLDDLIVDGELDGSPRRLSLQVKRQLTISAAVSNTDFRELIASSLKTRAEPDFRVGVDGYGFIAHTVADDRLNSFRRIITRAQASPTGADFRTRFQIGGEASQADIDLRDELLQLIQPADADVEVDFYRHFFAQRMDGLDEQGDRYAAMCNRLGQLAAAGLQEGPALAAALCRHVRAWEGPARVWTRPSLLSALKGLFRLKAAPSYESDIKIIQDLALAYAAEIRTDIGGVTIDRAALVDSAQEIAGTAKFSNISGLPGCGKSVVLRSFVERGLADGPALFLKSDRLEGSSWRSFAASIGLQHRSPTELLAEVGATGTAILFIDGIDRIKPEHRGIVTDLLNAIQKEPAFAQWRVVASSRDQGLEVLRSWIPASFYRQTGIGNVTVGPLDDTNSELLAEQQPHLRPLLFGAPNVREIARRPFFAAVLSDQLLFQGIDANAPPQTESELIAAWWRRGGYDAAPETAAERQRAILDFAEAGAQSLGKSIAARSLQTPTIAQATILRQDRIIEAVEEGSIFSFAHDIFFEWAYFRVLIDRGASWPAALSAAGEPPLLARIVGLLSQHVFENSGDWAGNFRALQTADLRPQWRRAWLLGPPSSPKFFGHLGAFEALLNADAFALLSKFLVWFQAERTIPNPLVLRNPNVALEGAALVRVADELGWPSDVPAWQRVILWILHRQVAFPVTATQLCADLFTVWQNMWGDHPNHISAQVIAVCEQWLIDLEKVRAAPDEGQAEPTRWNSLTSDAKSLLRSTLRRILFRSGRAYPDFARRALDRIIGFERRSGDLIDLVFAFSPILAEICPDRLAELLRVELIQKLPKERIEKEERSREAHWQWLREIRAKPEIERSDQERRAISNVPFLPGPERYDFHDVGLDYNHGSFYPPTPIDQPFASLFQSAPTVALALVRELANRAVTGWRQIIEINAPGQGTPIPLDIAFPWGQQRFWGDVQTYVWFEGHGMQPQPLQSAFLALTFWAHKSLDSGRELDGLIQQVVEGHESWTVLGLACSLALQRFQATEGVLPLITTQRLWHADLQRQVNESNSDINLFGFDPRHRITKDQRDAFDYLKTRRYRTSSIRELSYAFVLSNVEDLRAKLKAGLEAFPQNLPYNYEEEKSNEAYAASLLETAQIWAKEGDAANYKIEAAPDHPEMAVVSFRDPEPVPEALERKRQASANTLGDYNVVSWVNTSLEHRAPNPRWKLETVLKFARSRDSADLLIAEDRSGKATQACVAAAGAAAIQFGTDPDDIAWGWAVMERVTAIKDDGDVFRHSPNPMDPRLYLISTLVYDLRSGTPRPDSADRLITFAADENPSIAPTAIAGALVLHGASPKLAWVAAVLASDLFIAHRPVFQNKAWDASAQAEYRRASLQRARHALTGDGDAQLRAPPPAWMKGSGRRGNRRAANPQEADWGYPEVDFDAQFAAKVVSHFPVEAWCQSADYRGAFLTYLDALVRWTTDRLFPDWADSKKRDRHSTDLFEWIRALSGLIARILPFLPADELINRYIVPFSRHAHEDGLEVVSIITDKIICRHVYDAPIVADPTLAVLKHCLERMLQESAFDANGWRAGEVNSRPLAEMVRDFLLVSVENAPGATRFANGDWSDLPRLLPVVDVLMQRAGWSVSVTQTYLTLCERAAAAFPIDAFINHIKAARDEEGLFPNKWSGSTIAARISGVVQVLAEANHPLTRANARDLLIVLDRLVDMGDRRAAALQQSEHFRGVQMRA
jgi:hypothetical protein